MYNGAYGDVIIRNITYNVSLCSIILLLSVSATVSMSMINDTTLFLIKYKINVFKT